MNLTDRQVELISDLLETYYHNIFWDNVNVYIKCKEFWFNNKVYSIREEDYDIVCEIIDYIKGVKNG